MKHVFNYKSEMLDDNLNKVVAAGLELTKMYADANGKTGSDYEVARTKYNEVLANYCVTEAGFKYEGLSQFKNPNITGRTAFKEAFTAVIAQIITPVAPVAVSAQFMDMAETHQIGWGETAQFVIQSNDLFYVSEIAEGVKHGGMQRIYNDEITVNPTPKNIRFDMPFYQFAAGLFDFGAWSYKMGQSYAGYIQKQVVDSLTTVITNGLAASSPYHASGFSDLNHIVVARNVKMANANAQVYGMGTMVALGKAYPSVVGLQYGLGEEISKKGFLDLYKGVKLVEIDQAMMPGTVNTTATAMISDSTIYYIAMSAYKPIKIVFEGDAATVETVATESSDRTMGLSVTMRFGISAVVGSKFGSISSIV